MHDKPIRVLLVDDHVVVRAGLRMLLENHPGLKIAGEAGTRNEAIEIAEREKPDIILLDLNMGECSGLDFLPDLLSAAPKTKVVILTGVVDSEQHQQAVRLGAMGLVLKEKAAEVLISAIEKVHAGEVWLDRTLTASVLSKLTKGETGRQSDPESSKISTLTEREREVINLTAEGLKNKEIAGRLFISETTVRHHLTSIFGKLDVSGRFELMIYAYRHGLASPPR